MNDVLSGYTVGVTADRRAAEQIEMLERRGATCVHGPMLVTHPLVTDTEIAQATRRVIENPPDFTVLTTGIGVRSWFSAADSLLMGEDLRASIHASTVLARGPKAHGAAITADLDVAWNAPNAVFDEVVEELAARGVAGRRVAVQLDGDPDRAMVERLREIGAEVEPVAVYRWTMPEAVGAAQGLVRAVAEHRIDAITFTARPAVVNFVQIAQDMGLLADVRDAIRSGTQLFSVGPFTAGVIEHEGLGPPMFPNSGRLGPMVLTLTDQLDRSAIEVELAGHGVSLRGRLLQVGRGDSTLLTIRERSVFRMLASRPGVVFSKAALLEAVWRGETVDEHAVEATVGRLRRRLGEAGWGIETVIRRGYRLSAT